MMRSSFHQTKLATVSKARTAGPRSAIKTVKIQIVANGGHYGVLVREHDRDQRSYLFYVCQPVSIINLEYEATARENADREKENLRCPVCLVSYCLWRNQSYRGGASDFMNLP